MKISIRKAVMFLLSIAYFKEFRIIDGLNQHPLGYSFDRWLEENNLYQQKKDDKDDTSVAEQMTCR